MGCSNSARGRALSRALLVALGLLALTCEGEPVTDAGETDAGAGADAAPRHDGGPDADARTDADAPADGGFPPDPEWTAVAGTEGCIEVARQPEAVLRELPMRSCGAGCREVDVNWTGPREGDLFRVEDVVPDPSGGAMLLFRRRMREDLIQTLVSDSDGRVLAAYRSPFGSSRLCLMGPIAITPTRVALTLARFVSEDEAAPPLLLTADLASPSDVQLLHTFASPVFLQWLDASESVIAAGGVSTTARVTHDGAVEWMTGRFDALHDDAVFVTRTAGSNEIAVRDTQGERVLISLDDADVTGLRTDGRHMAWYVGSPAAGGAWDPASLHTATYTVESPVSARVLIDNDQRAPSPNFVVSHGHLLRTADVGGLVIYSLDDGSEVDRIPPDGDGAFAIATYAYLNDSELGFSVTRTNILPWATTYRWVQR